MGGKRKQSARTKDTKRFRDYVYAFPAKLGGLSYLSRMTKAQVGLFVITTIASGLALANCPDSMPVQLLVDCIVYEGAGSSFPTSDYARMDE
jgi:hypothetical protein